MAKIIAATFDKERISKFTSICAVTGAFSCGVLIFIWVLINTYVVVVIKMGAYIHGVLIFYGCLLSRFYGIFFVHCTV